MATKTAYSGPVFSPVAQMGMPSFLLVGRGAAKGNISCDRRLLAPVNELCRERLEAHHRPDRIAAINDGSGTKKDFRALCGEWIQGNHILEVAAAEYRGIHPDAVDGVQEPIGRESTDHGASATLLAFLDKYFPRSPQ